MRSDIHPVGVVSLYLASKFEDLYPLSSKVVGQRIAHGVISHQDIIDKEREFLTLFGFDLNMTTCLDFHQAFIAIYKNKLEQQDNGNALPDTASASSYLLQQVSKASLILVKMCMQSVYFCRYSQPLIVISAIYAATAFLKHSKEYGNFETTNHFVKKLRDII